MIVAALALYDLAVRAVLGRWPRLGSPVSVRRARARSLAVRLGGAS